MNDGTPHQQQHQRGGGRHHHGTRGGGSDRGHHQNRGRKENSRSSKGGGEAVPTTEELRAAVFAHGNVFRPKEKVIVPRSRGGFTFGYVLKPVPRHHCYVDPAAAVSANHQEWRVVYKNGNGEDLFKDLPPASLGKRRAPPEIVSKPVAILSRGTPVSADQPKAKKSQEATAVDDRSGSNPSSNSNSNSSADDVGGDDDEEEIEGEEVVFRGLRERSPDQPTNAIENVRNAAAAPPNGPPSVATLADRAPNKADVEEQGPAERRLGGQVIEKDLLAVSFSPINTFRDGELVVVPRSAGGFTYGIVQARCECLCPIGPPAHKHFGWRVNVDQAAPKPNFKDIFSAHLGKLHLAEAPPSTPSTPLAAAANGVRGSTSSAPSPRRRKDSTGGTIGAGPSSAGGGGGAGRRTRPEPKTSYEFAEVGDGTTPSATAGSTVREADLEYDFHYTSSSSLAPRSLAQQAAQAAGVGATAKYGKMKKKEDEDEEDYFEEYDEEPAAAAAARTAVPTFSGLFGSTSSATIPSTTATATTTARRRKPAPINHSIASIQAQPPQPQPRPESGSGSGSENSGGGGGSGGGEGTGSGAVEGPQVIDTSKKGVLCVQLPAQQANGSKKHQGQQRNQGQRAYNKGRGKKGKDANKPMIIMDGPNVAMRHGNNKKVSVKGLKLAIQYWERKGHQVIAFVPQHYLTRKAPTGPELRFSEFMPMADNLNMLQDLVDTGSVVLTPPQDYDDSYCIEYAKTHDAYIVTNDRYWDHVDKQPEPARPRIIRWLREHCISFTFVKDEFLPNPDFAFLPAAVPPPAEGAEK